MALRNVVMDGDPGLKKVCRPVTNFDDRLAVLLDDMKETMMEHDGLGLAAPQVGILRRVFVAVEESSLPRRSKAEQAEEMDDEAGEMAVSAEAEEEQEPIFLEFINPKIVSTEGKVRAYEGCLSFPGQYAAIGRPEKAVVQAQDRNGNIFEYVAEGMMARCVCHETNHLDGVTIDDLAEYFYDPETPHDLDATLHGGSEADGEDDGDGGAEEEV